MGERNGGLLAPTIAIIAFRTAASTPTRRFDHLDRAPTAGRCMSGAGSGRHRARSNDVGRRCLVLIARDVSMGMAMVGAKQAAVPFAIQGNIQQSQIIPDVKGMATGIATGIAAAALVTSATSRKSRPIQAGKAAGDILNLFRKKKE